MPDPLALAVATVLSRLPAPYAPPARAEAAAEERREFIPKTAVALVSAAQEATCTGAWAELECKRRWPGPPEEAVAMTGMLGWFESRLDPRIQNGLCEVYGPSPRQRECDGALFTSGVRPPGMPGLGKSTKWGYVVFKASTMYQLQGLSNERISEVVGLGEMSLFEASRQAMSTVAGFRSLCRNSSWETCVVTAYAGSMTFTQAPVRVALYRKMLTNIRIELANETTRRPVQAG